MVAIGSGGIFNGISYRDETGKLRDAEFYILNRVPLAKGKQYQQLYYLLQKNHFTGERIKLKRPPRGGNLSSGQRI